MMRSKICSGAILAVIVLLVAWHFSGGQTRAASSDGDKNAPTDTSGVQQIVIVENDYHPIDPDKDDRIGMLPKKWSSCYESL